MNEGATDMNIFQAAARPDVNIRQFRKVLAVFKDPNTVNAYGNTPLHHAAATGSVAKVKALLAAGADVNKRSPDGATALHFCAHYGTPGKMQILLAAGADPTIKCDMGKTALDNVNDRVKNFAHKGDYRAMRRLLGVKPKPRGMRIVMGAQ